MELFLAFIFFCASLISTGIATGIVTTSAVRPIERETTVKFCIEKPAECKKEYDFYQMRTEFEASKENK
jgi:hypothetical protein